MNDQSVGAASVLQQIQSVCEKAGLDVPTTFFEAQKLLAPELATIPENYVLSAAITAVSVAFKVIKESLQKIIDELIAELCSRQCS